MTDPTRPETQIADVLAAHDWQWAIRDSRTGDGVRIACAAPDCKWHAERIADTDDVFAAHLAHVAAVLNAEVVQQAIDNAAAEALWEAGSKVANYRNGATGRRPANADLFGQMVHAMGDEREYQSERRARAAASETTEADQ